jgi:hypothetical protein
MGVSIRRFHEHDVSLLTLQGVVRAEELTDFARRIDSNAPSRVVTYVDPGADLSQIDLQTITDYKRLMGRRLKAQFAGRKFRSAIVCDSRLNEPIIRLWANYVGRDDDYPANPAVFSTLGQACDYLGLEAAARAALSEAIGVAPPSDAARDAARR